MIKKLKNNLVEGARNPSKILQYCNRKRAEFTIRHNNAGVATQKRKVEELLEEDEFLLIIFDSCRYDYFEEMYSSCYTGDIEQVYSTNTYTKQY